MTTAKRVRAKSSKEEWAALLMNDGAKFMRARRAMREMIESVVAEKGGEWSAMARRHAITLCLAAVPLTAERYLRSFIKTRHYKFSTYYSWYLREIINNFNPDALDIDDETRMRLGMA